MKHFVTAFLFCFAAFAASASAQSKAIPQNQRVAVPHAPIFAEPSIFLTPQTTASEFSKLGGQLSPQTKGEQLSYFSDTTSNFFTILGGKDSFTIAKTPGGTDSLTFYNWGYAERFSTSLKNPYLDSIQVLLGIISVPANNMITCIVDHSREDTNHTTQVILPGPDQHNTAIASKSVLGSALQQGMFNTVTFKFPPASTGKKLAPGDHNFWAYIDQGGKTPYEDSIYYCFDKNVQSKRDIDSTIDRTNVVTLDAARQYFIEYSLAGNYRLIADTTQVYYPNMIAIAYLHDPTAGVSESSNLPSGFRLAQNFPNPFNPSTDINYALPVQSQVTLKVTNSLGQEMATLVNSTQRAGEHSVHFDASNLPSGTYFYTLKAGSFTETHRMVLSK